MMRKFPINTQTIFVCFRANHIGMGLLQVCAKSGITEYDLGTR